MTLECPLLQWLRDGKYVAPKRCSESGCRSRKFHPDRDAALIADWQKIKLQEIDDDKRDAGRVPRTVEASRGRVPLWPFSSLEDLM